jgi:hypothetical protein
MAAYLWLVDAKTDQGLQRREAVIVQIFFAKQSWQSHPRGTK